MFMTTLTADKSTGETRILRYDANGYSVVVGNRIELEARLRAICYLMDPEDREFIARVQGLQDAGELTRASAESNADRRIPRSGPRCSESRHDATGRGESTLSA